MARRLCSINKAKPLSVIKVAFSGTGFVSNDWNPGNPCYTSLVTEVKIAMALAERDNVKLNLRAIVWVQGESDAASDSSAAAYEKNLSNMLTSLRKELNAPRMTALLGVNGKFGGGSPALSTVIAGQKAIAKNPEMLAIFVDTDGAELANGAHFSAKGTLEVGRRFADALLAH